MLNPWDKISAVNESISVARGLLQRGQLEPSGQTPPFTPSPPTPPPHTLLKPATLGHDALLNSSTGFHASEFTRQPSLSHCAPRLHSSKSNLVQLRSTICVFLTSSGHVSQIQNLKTGRTVKSAGTERPSLVCSYSRWH